MSEEDFFYTLRGFDALEDLDYLIANGYVSLIERNHKLFNYIDVESHKKFTLNDKRIRPRQAIRIYDDNEIFIVDIADEHRGNYAETINTH